MYHYAGITLWDGRAFTTTDERPLVSSIHSGPLFFQTTQRVGSGVMFEASWPGEPYVAEVMDSVYRGGNRLELNINNLHVEIRWLIVITSS